MLIGLTGTYCAGKNHVAAILEKQGLPVLDVDKLGYKALEIKKEAILTEFGNDLLLEDNSLNRRLLGQRVFGKPDKLAALEVIVHPVMNRLAEEWITNQSSAFQHCVINAAILHKSTVFKRLDIIILVTAPFFTRLLRAKRRDKLAIWDILKRFSSQKNFISQYLTANAEIYRVENPGFFFSKHLQKKLECRITGILQGV